ncbi:MAG: TolC family protein [Syntrophobacterales bacterium]|jgi:cobalt-zinc-cadmium efflux system outer membrane protein|nr:TolC family protein [Syntrophobacterales bacterium]
MVNLKRLAVGVVFCLAPYWSGGALADSRTYALPELEEMALKTHPALKIAGAEISKSEADLRIARQYPNPEVEGLVSSQRAMEGGTYGSGFTVGLSQTLEWPGRRGKKQEAARFGINSARQKLTQEQINVRARCRELYYQVLADEQLVKIAAENLESAKTLLDIAEKRVRLGESRPIELVKARVEFFSLEREDGKAKTTLAGDRQVLQEFLGGGLPADFALSAEAKVVDPAVPLKRWQEAALASHPLLAAQEAQVRQAESNLGAERQAWVPEVTVKAFHIQDVDLHATGGGVSLPLPLWNRKEGEVAKAAAAQSQAKSELRLLKQDLETRLAAQYGLYATARRQVESFRSAILKEAAESLRVAQFSYEHGETSLLELLDSRRVYRGTEQDYQKALLDYRLARVELWRLAGGGVK